MHERRRGKRNAGEVEPIGQHDRKRPGDDREEQRSELLLLDDAA